MNGWIKTPKSKKWHQVRNYSCYAVAHALCGIRWHPRDKRLYQTSAYINIRRGNKCSKCEDQALVLELAQ